MELLLASGGQPLTLCSFSALTTDISEQLLAFGGLLLTLCSISGLAIDILEHLLAIDEMSFTVYVSIELSTLLSEIQGNPWSCFSLLGILAELF